LSASGVGAEIDLETLPLSDALRTAFDTEAQQLFALSGGDDYELCFTAPEGTSFDANDLRITKIGMVTAGEKLVCRDARGIVEYSDRGYRHFR